MPPSFRSTTARIVLSALSISWIADLLVPFAHAGTALPYSTRTKAYSGWSTSVRGDIRTVGMAGATLGLADTFIAATENPAGLAMTLGTGDFNYSSNSIHDDYIQNYDAALSTSNVGTAVAAYPWGFSAGYIAPYQEGQAYTLAGFPNDPASLSLTVRELHLGAARVFRDNRFSLGASLVLGQAEHEIEFQQLTDLSAAHHSYAVGATLGAMAQLPRRVLIGMSYRLPMRFGADPTADPTRALPGFFQPLNLPGRLGLGVGWIPNRFFRADFTTYLVGTTGDATLLRDESVEIGRKLTLQPRFGLAYNLADFSEFSATAFVGLYYEVTRVQVSSSRLHNTEGVEAKPWIFTLGWGMDDARGYKDYLVTLGVDVFKAMEKLDLIPTPWRPPHGGFLPNPAHQSDEGLARPLVKDWKQQGPEMDPFKVGLELPKRLEERMLRTGDDIKKIGEGVLDTIQFIPKTLLERKQPR